MMYFLIISGVVLVIGLIVFLVLRNKTKTKEPLSVRHAVTVAKTTLQNKAERPDIFKRLKNKTEIPFDAIEENHDRAEIPGTYHLRWPHLQVGYVFKDNTEKIVLQLDGFDEIVTLFYGDGVLNGVNRGKETLDAEDFEMRHAGTISEQLRAFVRFYLRFPGGSLKVDKAPEPTFKPSLDLKKSGDIKLKGPPPPGKQPNFMDGE